MRKRHLKKMLKKKSIIAEKELFSCKYNLEKKLEELLRVGFLKSDNIALSDYPVSDEEMVFLTINRDDVSRQLETLKKSSYVKEIEDFVFSNKLYHLGSFNDMLRSLGKLRLVQDSLKH